MPTIVLAAQLSMSVFLFGWALAATAAIAVFLHVDRNGGRHATAWGIGVFLFLGLFLPLYVIHYRRNRSKRRY